MTRSMFQCDQPRLLGEVVGKTRVLDEASCECTNPTFLLQEGFDAEMFGGVLHRSHGEEKAEV